MFLPPVLPLVPLFQYLEVLWALRVRLGRDHPGSKIIHLLTTHQKTADDAACVCVSTVVGMCCFLPFLLELLNQEHQLDLESPVVPDCPEKRCHQRQFIRLLEAWFR